ncbi:acyl-CoA dehydrogenase family protein [Mycolicibacterium neoaurum]|uniref:acyl-CoA dehydrogenase family protein n=1 Tax=Mycolicibacterium neoaurum TaxID=1795 RepID=UPI00248B81D9|nr:acyl-CoA dehydrogenase family protein [Mycolicibacterium neoaurum]WBP96617.1 acyl-CoA dehydrogenase family protein [Mycolicibacterium neoaurum]WBS10303.1 acyl-CoA dehydrogenase family protein [Mycolicibacterium neoaurum]
MKRTLFDDEHEMFRESVRTFIGRELTKDFEQWERAGIIDKAVFTKAGAAGILGVAVPEQYGGGGLPDFRFNAVFLEEVCRAGVMNAGLGISNHADVVVPYIIKYGTPEQQQRWLPGLTSGELVGAIAMTEPNTGSDLAAISSSAVRDGDSYVLNGNKVFISNGINADLVIVVCRTGFDGPAQRNLSLLVVESDRVGFSRGRNLDKVGQHSADTAELFFDNVVLPADNLLGEQDRGFYQLMSMLPQERLSIAVMALAHAQAAFDETLTYCKTRHAFGQPIGSFQNSRFQLATMRTELDVAQSFVDAQLTAHLAGELTGEEAAQAKWWCTDLNNRVLQTCVQLHGAYGYMEECAVGRAWRDGRAMAIYGGTNEIMKDIIGRRMLGV